MREPLPFYGAGPEYCSALREEIVDHLPALEVFELIPENFFWGRHQWFLKELAKAGTPVIIHGIELSVGTDAPFKQDHFDQMRRVGDQVNMIAMSDHICMTEAGGTDVGQLTTLPFTRRSLDVVRRHVDLMSRQVSVPIVLENIANQFYYPDCDFSETEFIAELTRQSDAYLLLDLHNLYANSENFDFDPYQWLGEIDLEKVWAIHLAGGYYDYDRFLEDGHSSPVPEPVWQLLRWVTEKARPPATIVERTSEYPGIASLLAEVQRARKEIGHEPGRVAAGDGFADSLSRGQSLRRRGVRRQS